MVFLARNISGLGVGTSHDPGPKAFPTLLGILLIIGGLFDIAFWIRQRINILRSITSPLQPPDGRARTPLTKSAVLLLILSTYILSMTWVGFTVSTLVFAPIMMLLLGTQLRLAILCSVLLVILIKGIFGLALRVPLPAGELGIPF